MLTPEDIQGSETEEGDPYYFVTSLVLFSMRYRRSSLRECTEAPMGSSGMGADVGWFRNEHMHRSKKVAR